MDWTLILFGVYFGLAILAVIYDGVLFAALRGEFLVWHAIACVAFAVMAVGAISELSIPFIAEDSARRALRLVGSDLALAVGGPFIAAYVEKGMIGPRLTKALRMTMPVILASTILVLGLGRVPELLMARNLMFLACLGLTVSALLIALMRGSRAAKFLSLAWSAGLGVCGWYLYSNIVLQQPMQNWTEKMLVAIAFDIIVSSAGIADRFVILKRDLDQVREAEMYARDAAITDPLTQLRNRRGLALRFKAEDRDRPRGLAIIDLDHFKHINDTYGHDVGDDVLVAVAGALQGKNRFAARLGGEEFALILFGDDWEMEAEDARQSVRVAVAHKVGQVATQVTASAGLTAIKRGMNFSDLLRTADRALYQAKRRGRNRIQLASVGDYEIGTIERPSQAA